MKRFYTLVSFTLEAGGYAIKLDGKPVKTPGRNLLLAPTKIMAEALQAEWAGQGEEIIPDTMPITQILNTRIDKIPENRDEIEAMLLKYLDTDLLCYRCDFPPEVAEVQKMLWDPWLEWFEKKFGTALQTTEDLAAIKQPHGAAVAVKDWMGELDPERFNVLQIAVPLVGSLVLGLAFVEGSATSDQLLRAAFAEEDYKSILYKDDQYGPDPLTEKKRLAMRRDLDGAALYLALSQK